MGTLIGQNGQLTLGIDDPRPFLRGFGSGLYDYGTRCAFSEKPSLEISKFGVDLIVDRLRATNRSTFLKTEKFEKFFFKKNFNFRKLKFFLKKTFQTFQFFKKCSDLWPLNGQQSNRPQISKF